MDMRRYGMVMRGLEMGIPLNEQSHIEIVVPSTHHVPSILSALLNSHNSLRRSLHRKKLRQEMLRPA